MVLVIIVARALIYLEMLKLERRFLNDWVEDAQRRVSGNEFQFGTKKKCKTKIRNGDTKFVAAMINDS